ncbi:uncharacterized protein LOC127262373 [Andrographis paniculata]|uniref:uncharacterized protein LOC127262373 n=1 Tax=Andrographis paniculata TaxID=175694 RepID=UPI0021E8B0B9|nr:uncharacterized protein LOC127262373 [Andrographis paniculata]
MELEEIGSMAWKIGLFVVVQGLVYLILSQSSNVFSRRPAGVGSFRPAAARSLSIQRWAAALADVPAASADSPSPRWTAGGFFRSFSGGRDR